MKGGAACSSSVLWVSLVLTCQNGAVDAFASVADAVLRTSPALTTTTKSPFLTHLSTTTVRIAEQSFAGVCTPDAPKAWTHQHPSSSSSPAEAFYHEALESQLAEIRQQNEKVRRELESLTRSTSVSTSSGSNVPLDERLAREQEARRKQQREFIQYLGRLQEVAQTNLHNAIVQEKRKGDRECRYLYDMIARKSQHLSAREEYVDELERDMQSLRKLFQAAVKILKGRTKNIVTLVKERTFFWKRRQPEKSIVYN